MGRSEFLFLAAIVGCVAPQTYAAGAQPVSPQREMRLIEMAPPVEPPVPGDGRAVLVPTTAEYEWTFRVPVLSVEHRRVYFSAPDLSARPKHWTYETPGLRSKKIKLWDAPEIHCKYPDLILPNECKTVWHGVYVDVPVLVSERTHVDLDVLQLGVKQSSIVVDIAHLAWVEKRFRFSLPAMAPYDSVQRLRASLNGQRDAVAAASDGAIAAIDREIETVRASGEDPANLVADDGSSIDLLAQRQSLVEERAGELQRLAGIDAELSLFPTGR